MTIINSNKLATKTLPYLDINPENYIIYIIDIKSTIKAGNKVATSHLIDKIKVFLYNLSR
jgi:hypothetical protein